MRKLVLPSLTDPLGGFDVYDGDRVSVDGDVHCVAMNLRSEEEIERAWASYESYWCAK